MEQQKFIKKVYEIFNSFGYVRVMGIHFNKENISFIYYVMNNRVDKFSIPYRFVKEEELRDYIISKVWC